MKSLTSLPKELRIVSQTRRHKALDVVSAVTEPPDTPATKPIDSVNGRRPAAVRAVSRSSASRTPGEKAAARVPPPEKASPTMVSSTSLVCGHFPCSETEAISALIGRLRTSAAQAASDSKKAAPSASFRTF